MVNYKEVVIRFNREDHSIDVWLDDRKTTTKIIPIFENAAISRFETEKGFKLDVVAERLSVKLDLLRNAVRSVYNNHVAISIPVIKDN